MSKHARTICCFAVLAGSLSCSSSKPEKPTQATSASVSAPLPPVVSLCDVMKDSQTFVGKQVTMTVRIEAFKHGTAIWDPACKQFGADLHFPTQDQQSKSIGKLLEVLNQHGMGDHPVIATLTGTWLGTQYYAHQFIAQPRIVFEASDASEITRSEKIERLY